jgi:hypothetical protein
LVGNGLFTVIVPHSVSIFLRFQDLGQLGCDVVRRTKIKTGHLFNYFLVQRELKRLPVR